ncbi:hypothetical protein Tco_0237996 [Tanacetum coccineum]
MDRNLGDQYVGGFGGTLGPWLVAVDGSDGTEREYQGRYQHGKAIQGIQEHLLEVPIQEKLRALRDRLDVAEA